MIPAGGDRLAHYGLGQAAREAPPRWVSELAEELAGKIEAGLDPGSVSLRIREAADEHRIPDHWFVTQLVAHEWDRLGIRSIPRQLELGGW
jgi:hypothetical protein